MNLTPYVETVRQGVTDAASLADENTQQVAHRLGAAIDSSTRLALIEALSDAAASISADLAPSSVEVRMAGSEPELVVSVPSSPSEPTMLMPESEQPPSQELGDDDEEPLARITLRLPASVKSRVDELAAKDAISTNAWLIRAVTDALAERRRDGWPTLPAPPSPPGGPFGGGLFGPHGPFGPHGVFGPSGPFGERARDASREHQDHPHGFQRKGWNSSSGVQGWAR
jgi:hypothetical protein